MKRRSPSAAMYVLFEPGVILEVLHDRESLVTTYAAYGVSEEASAASLEAYPVLADALLEHAVWSHPSSWEKAKAERDRTGFSLFWIGYGHIRQSVVSMKAQRRWRELDVTVLARRRAKARFKLSAESICTFPHRSLVIRGARVTCGLYAGHGGMHEACTAEDGSFGWSTDGLTGFAAPPPSPYVAPSTAPRAAHAQGESDDE